MLLGISHGTGTVTEDWSTGKFAWNAALQASTMSATELWNEENVCDPRAVAGSAPLTVLFGVSSFWETISKQRKATGTSEPLEVHVIGASYPFEGRADWSLLASRRPADVPGVRVVLVLGTPWQGDNLPTLKHDSALQFNSTIAGGLGAAKDHPIGGRWSNGGVKCTDAEAMKTYDASFTKQNLCRDHGNGLEVVCLEKFYQDSNLKKPDIAVMFSPGFPQLARRSWDSVLQDLLDKDVIVMVNDEVFGESLNSMFLAKDSKGTAPGAAWKPTAKRQGEDTDTLIAMRAYRARRRTSRRNPFPLIIREGKELIAKNAVVQVFQGRLDGATRMSLPTATVLAADTAAVNKFDWKKFESGYADDIKKSLLTPVSPAYEEACRAIHEASLRGIIQRKGVKFFGAKDRGFLRRLGLVGRATKQEQERWGPQAWLFFLKHLDMDSFT